MRLFTGAGVSTDGNEDVNEHNDRLHVYGPHKMCLVWRVSCIQRD